MPPNDRTQTIRFPCECDRFIHSLRTALEIPEPHAEDVENMERTLVRLAQGRRDDLEHLYHSYIGDLIKVPIGQTENVRRVFEGEKARCRTLAPIKPLRVLLSAPFRIMRGGAGRVLDAGVPWIVTIVAVCILVGAFLLLITFGLVIEHNAGAQFLGMLAQMILAIWIIIVFVNLWDALLDLIPKRRGTRREWRAARKEWKRRAKEREKRSGSARKGAGARPGILKRIADGMGMLFHDCPDFPEESDLFTFDSFINQIAPSGLGVSAEMSEAYRKAPLSNFAYLPGALIRYRFWPEELERAEREGRPTDPVRVVARTFTALAMHRFFVKHGRWPGPGDLDKGGA